jgi:alkanesulfonate monooxygenase SsuD/methylene tetrahydromethanopterin reductase-like flavin-dependent oxidoreductase (luciferase family)
MNAALERLYGRRLPAIEAAAFAGTPAGCVAAARDIATAGAGLILFSPMFSPAEHAEVLAAEVIPQLR